MCMSSLCTVGEVWIAVKDELPIFPHWQQEEMKGSVIPRQVTLMGKNPSPATLHHLDVIIQLLVPQ